MNYATKIEEYRIFCYDMLQTISNFREDHPNIETQGSREFSVKEFQDLVICNPILTSNQARYKRFLKAHKVKMYKCAGVVEVSGSRFLRFRFDPAPFVHIEQLPTREEFNCD